MRPSPRLNLRNWLLSLLFLHVTICVGCSSGSSTTSSEPVTNATPVSSVVGSGVVRYEKPMGSSSDLTPYPNPVFRASAAYDHNRLNQLAGSNNSSSPNSMRITAGGEKSSIWSLALDKSRYTYEMAEDFKLDFPYDVPGRDNPVSIPHFVAADLNGAFIIMANAPNRQSLRLELKSSNDSTDAAKADDDNDSKGRKKPRGKPTPKSKQNEANAKAVRRFEIVEKPLDNISVYDLRTGKVAGTLDWKVPAWCDSALSPNGKYFVGPFHVLHRQFSTPTDDAAVKELEEYYQAIYVWELNKAEYTFRLPMADTVRWYGFIGTQEIAVYIGKSDGDQLQFWNVTTGKMRTAIDLPFRGWGPLDPNYPNIHQPPTFDSIVGVSPRGKYLAVLGRDKLLMVSSQTATVEGEVQLEHQTNEIGSVHFSDDASSIAVCYPLPIAQSVRSGVVLIDAITGVKKAETILHGAQHGAIVWHSDFEFVVSDFSRTKTSYVPVRGTAIQSVTNLLPIRMCDAGKLLSVPLAKNGHSLGKLEVSDRSLLDTSLPQDLATIELKGAGRTVSLDRSSVQYLGVEPCKTWSPITIGEQAVWKFDRFKGEPANASTGNNAVGMFVDQRLHRDGVHMARTQFIQVDTQAGTPLGPPINLRKWVPPYDELASLPCSMSPDGSQLVVVDPHELSSIKVIGPMGEPLFRCRLLDVPIQWLSFLADGTLLALGDAQLLQVSLARDSAKALYMKAGYRAPVLLLADLKTAVVSRGQILEVFDATTGQVVGTLGTEAKEPLFDLCVSPDGKQLAALYSDATKPKQKDEMRPATLAVWDLETGQAVIESMNFLNLRCLSWLSSEHVCVCSQEEATVFDLKLKALTLTYIFNPSEALVRAGGHLWWTRTSSPPEENKDYRFWESLSTPARRSLNPGFFRPDRKIVELRKTPIALEIKVEDYSLPSNYGSHIVQKLEQLGFKMGANGLTLRITARIGPSGDHLDKEITGPGKEVPLPMVYFKWEVLDQRQRAFFDWQTEGRFLYKQSQFYKKSDEFSDKYVFNTSSPRREIVQEIIDNGIGLTDLPDSFPKFAIESDEGFTVAPQRLTWR